ncbi:MAG: thermonuclease family protein [Anaerovoracaceae bacterium]
MRKNTKYLLSLAIFILIFSFTACTNSIFDNTPGEKEPAYVSRVIDGDTIKVELNSGEKESLRLIGIDTPESVHPDKAKNSKEGKIASSYTKKILEGKNVGLEFDLQERDKYGRLLAYVYIEDELINLTLLKEGYAKTLTVPPNIKYESEFLKAQRKAAVDQKGFWKDFY